MQVELNLYFDRHKVQKFYVCIKLAFMELESKFFNTTLIEDFLVDY